MILKSAQEVEMVVAPIAAYYEREIVVDFVSTPYFLEEYIMLTKASSSEWDTHTSFFRVS